MRINTDRGYVPVRSTAIAQAIGKKMFRNLDVRRKGTVDISFLRNMLTVRFD